MSGVMNYERYGTRALVTFVWVYVLRMRELT